MDVRDVFRQHRTRSTDDSRHRLLNIHHHQYHSPPTHNHGSHAHAHTYSTSTPVTLYTQPVIQANSASYPQWEGERERTRAASGSAEWCITKSASPPPDCDYALYKSTIDIDIDIDKSVQRCLQRRHMCSMASENHAAACLLWCSHVMLM